MPSGIPTVHGRLPRKPPSPRRAELLAIADTLSRVPARPAETFREALQSINFFLGTLFMTTVVSLMCDELREVNIDFGALPMPKFDEEQENYATMINVATPYMAVPTTVGHADTVGFIIEALSAASYEIDDVYFNTCLEGKYARDRESPEMLRLARENIVYDPGFIYNWANLGTNIWKGVINANQGYASLIAGSRDNAVKKMEEMMETFAEATEGN